MCLQIIEAMMSNEDSLSHAEDDELLIEQLFSSAVTATEDNRCLTDMFRVLPSKTVSQTYQHHLIHLQTIY